MNAKRLILSPQDRGGIGKSFVATLLYDYLVEAKVKLKTFDLDHANSTFKRLVPEAEFIHTDVDAHKLAVLDRLVSALETVDTVLVDNRATGGSKLLEYIKDSRLTELQKTLQFDIVFVVIAVDDRDAISQAADVLDDYGKRVNWLVVKNYRDSTELKMFDESDTRKGFRILALSKWRCPVYPRSPKTDCRCSISRSARVVSSDKLHILDQSRCVRFHAYMQNQFDKARTLLVP
jgi:hypothetical protein